MAERVSMEDLNSPFSLSDFKKRIFYYKLIWKFGPAKGAAIYVFLLFVPILLLSIAVVGFIMDSFWPASSGQHTESMWNDPITWIIMGVIFYYVFKKQAEKQRYHIKKELRRRAEEKAGPSILNETIFRHK